ncbi:MAG: hypothetical protein U1E34_15085 [Amaricoccus sp.]
MIRPEIAAWVRVWREPLLWGALLLAGLWLVWQGYLALEPATIALGLLCAAAGLGLLRDALRRARLRLEAPAEGMVLIDEGRIAYLGPRGGGFIDLPSIVAVEIVTRPHVPPASGHVWLLTAEDGERLTIPVGAKGADRLFDALSPLPGIDFDAGVAAILGPGAHRATVWRREGWRKAG